MSKRLEARRKWETIRRLRYGCLIRLFRHRYGHQLPDDDAGIADLWLLLQNVSLAISEREKKMRHVIAVWAPWLLRHKRPRGENAESQQPGSSDLHQRLRHGGTNEIFKNRAPGLRNSSRGRPKAGDGFGFSF
jgi:hypothetical protein